MRAPPQPRGKRQGSGASRPPSARPRDQKRASARTKATSASAMTAPGTTWQVSERWCRPTASSPVARSTLRRARGTVEIGLNAARATMGAPLDVPPSMPPAWLDGAGQVPIRAAHDLVVCGGTEQGGLCEAVTDFDALDGLDRHECGGQACIEALACGHVRAQPHGNVVGDHLNDAADGVTRMLRGVDGGLKAGVVSRIERAHRGLAQRRFVGGRWNQRGLARCAPTDDDMGNETNAGDLLQEGLGEHARVRRARRSRGRSRVQGRAEPRTGRRRACPAGPRDRDEASCSGRFRAISRSSPVPASMSRVGGIDGIGTHDRLPLGPLGVADTNAQPGAPVVTPWRTPARIETSSASNFCLSSAAVAEASTRKATAQVLGRHMQPGGQALDRGEQCGSVRFTGGHPSQHASQCPTSDKPYAQRLSRAERSRLRCVIPVRSAARFRAENIDDDAECVVTRGQIRRDRDRPGVSRPSGRRGPSRVPSSLSPG